MDNIPYIRVSENKFEHYDRRKRNMIQCRREDGDGRDVS